MLCPRNSSSLNFRATSNIRSTLEVAILFLQKKFLVQRYWLNETLKTFLLSGVHLWFLGIVQPCPRLDVHIIGVVGLEWKWSDEEKRRPGHSYWWGLSIFFQEYIYGLSPLSPELSFRCSLLVGVADTLDITDSGTSDRDIVWKRISINIVS